jgi:1-phosphofructokinase
MNPAIDKTVHISKLQIGALNRLKQVEIDAGGKGINVSKIISTLGGESIACGFLGKEGSEQILATLQEENIICDFIKVEGRTRTNLKVIEEDKTLTELNEPGMFVPQEAVVQLKRKLLTYANENSLFVISGSAPRGVEVEVYGELIEQLREKGATVFLDVDGKLLAGLVTKKPDFIKPNVSEIIQLFGDDESCSEVAFTKYALRLRDMGIPMFSISRGAKGAMFFVEGKLYQCPGLNVDLESSVGSGDAIVAAFAHAWENKLSTMDTIQLAMAVSAGVASTYGTKAPDLKLIEKLKVQVQIHTVLLSGDLD